MIEQFFAGVDLQVDGHIDLIVGFSGTGEGYVETYTRRRVGLFASKTVVMFNQFSNFMENNLSINKTATNFIGQNSNINI